MRLRIKFSVTIGDEEPSLEGPDTEAQVGHIETVGFVETGLGFTAPGPKLDEAFE